MINWLLCSDLLNARTEGNPNYYKIRVSERLYQEHNAEENWRSFQVTKFNIKTVPRQLLIGNTGKQISFVPKSSNLVTWISPTLIFRIQNIPCQMRWIELNQKVVLKSINFLVRSYLFARAENAIQTRFTPKTSSSISNAIHTRKWANVILFSININTPGTSKENRLPLLIWIYNSKES